MSNTDNKISFKDFLKKEFKAFIKTIGEEHFFSEKMFFGNEMIELVEKWEANTKTPVSYPKWVRVLAEKDLPKESGVYNGKYGEKPCIIFFEGTEIVRIKFPDGSIMTPDWHNLKDYKKHKIFWLDENPDPVEEERCCGQKGSRVKRAYR